MRGFINAPRGAPIRLATEPMSKDYIFTSESVSEGHPDKMADQISDAVLDEIYRRDPNHAKARVACETLVKTGFVMLAGEITVTDADLKIDYEKVVRRVVKEIGYDNSDVGFDGNNCGVLIALGEQSKDINQGVDRETEEAQGAGDQGLMFGYATNETDMLMPAPIDYAHRLVKRQAEVRKNGTLPWLRPDAKSQITIRYADGKPVCRRRRGALHPAQRRRQRERAARGGDGRDHQARARRAPAGSTPAPSTTSTRPASSSSAARSATAV